MQKSENFDKITQVKGTRVLHNGASPSGKATDSDSVIRVFESLRPSHKKDIPSGMSFFGALGAEGENPDLSGGRARRQARGTP